jgi:hypothetical protein
MSRYAEEVLLKVIEDDPLLWKYSWVVRHSYQPLGIILICFKDSALPWKII